MQETLITFETAKLAKEKGWKKVGLCLDYYKPDGTKMKLSEYNEEFAKFCTQYCTQSLLQKWLREVHKLDVSLHLNQFGYGYMYAINDVTKCKNIVELKGGPDYKWTYEEALEIGLQEALKLIK
jgi:hypothetical protein